MTQSSSDAASKRSLDELAGRASKSTTWAIVGQGGGPLIRLGSNLVLTRLLLAEHFGLMALVNVLLTGLQLFSDIGIGPTLIQNKREDPDFVNTVWTMQVFRGLVLCALAILVAAPYASFYEQPILQSLVQVAALTVAIRGLTSTSVVTERRHLHLKRPILLKLIAQLSGVAVMVVGAWYTGSVWALVIGGVVSSMVQMVLSHVWLPGLRNRFRLERDAVRTVLSFGSWIFLGTVAIFAANNLDRIIFGKITTMTTLGVYSIGALLALAPANAILGISRSVLFPLYSRIHYSSNNLSEVFLSARRPLLVVGAWVTAGSAAGGPTIVRLLYDSGYWEAGWMLQVLSVGLWFGVVLGGTVGSVVLASGRSDWTAAAGFGKVLGIVTFAPLGYWLAGFPGAVAGISASELLRYGVIELAAVKLGFDGRRQDLVFTLRMAVSALIAWLTVRGLTELGLTHAFLHALVVFVVVTLFWFRPLSELVGRLRRRESIFVVEAPAAKGGT